MGGTDLWARVLIRPTTIYHKSDENLGPKIFLADIKYQLLLSFIQDFSVRANTSNQMLLKFSKPYLIMHILANIDQSLGFISPHLFFSLFIAHFTLTFNFYK